MHAYWPKSRWQICFKRSLNKLRKVWVEVETGHCLDFVYCSNVAGGPGSPWNILRENYGECADVQSFLRHYDLVEFAGNVYVSAGERFAGIGRDAANDHPYLSIAGGPKVGNPMLDVAPDPPVQLWRLRRYVPHQECFTAFC